MILTQHINHLLLYRTSNNLKSRAKFHKCDTTHLKLLTTPNYTKAVLVFGPLLAPPTPQYSPKINDDSLLYPLFTINFFYVTLFIDQLVFRLTTNTSQAKLVWYSPITANQQTINVNQCDQCMVWWSSYKALID